MVHVTTSSSTFQKNSKEGFEEHVWLVSKISYGDLHHCIAATKHYILKNQNFAQSYFSVKKRFIKSVVPGV